jgi:hypothetical protein
VLLPPWWMAAPRAISQEFTGEKSVWAWFYVCIENKLYDKGGDIWTGRRLSQGIKRVRSLKKKITLKWKVKGGILEKLDKVVQWEERWHAGMGCQHSWQLMPWSALNNSARWKRNMSPGSNTIITTGSNYYSLLNWPHSKYRKRKTRQAF